MANKCYHCGSPLDEGSHFCKICGTLQDDEQDSRQENKQDNRPDDGVICPKCGTRFAAGTRFCGVCGAPLSQQQKPVQPEPEPLRVVTEDKSNTPFFTPPAEAQRAARPFRPDRVNTEPPRQSPPPQRYGANIPAWDGGPLKSRSSSALPKKRSKILPIVIAACVLAILATVLGVFVMPMIGDYNDAGVTFKKNGSEYYLSSVAYRLGDDDPVTLTVEDGKSTYYFGVFDPEKTVYAKGSLYLTDTLSDEKLSKYRFSGSDTLVREDWVSRKTLEDCFLNTEDDDLDWVQYIRNPKTDGKWVYFTFVPTGKNAADYQEVAYRMGRISLDGETIEQIGEIRAGDFTLHDGWIYYYDNGYDYDKDDGVSIDSSRIGIYKIKPDGGSERSIKKFSDPAMASVKFEGLAPAFIDELTVSGDKLYFLDYTPAGKGRVCRMNRNGSDKEYVSYSAAQHYTVDEKNNVVYFTEGDYSSDWALPAENDENSALLLRFDIPSEEEKKDREKEKEDKDDKDNENEDDDKEDGDDALKKDEEKICELPVTDARLSCYQGYVYFCVSSFDFGDGEKAKGGMRVNTDNGRIEYLAAYHVNSESDVNGNQRHRDDNDNITFWIGEKEY